MSSRPKNRICELRKAAGLSMEQLALLCEPPTTAPTINKLEKGETKLTQPWMERLGKALGVEPVELLRPLPKLSPEDEEFFAALAQLSPAKREAFIQLIRMIAAETIDAKTDEAA